MVLVNGFWSGVLLRLALAGAGIRRIRAWGNPAPGLWPFCGAVAVPVTRVFSPYVVQAGWARPRVRAGLLLQRSTGLVRRSGRPGESCPGLSAR